MALKVGGLFAGIGGFEVGLSKSGWLPEFFCEILPEAQSVLRSHFEDVPIYEDIASLDCIPYVDVLTAGFPCQDLSIAGGKGGIKGRNSSTVHHLFRILKKKQSDRPDWILIENVPYMLSLDKGEAMSYLISEIEDAGYSWAYRVIDARCLGVNQRRPRVILIASMVEHPKNILFNQDLGVNPFNDSLSSIEEDKNYGFYWTEGLRGIGWAHEAVPPIKGGSGIGIPSPPAVWNSSDHFLGTPTIQDAERLQGFPAGWTAPIESNGFKTRHRWRLIGNAMCVAVSEWLGQCINSPACLSEELYETNNRESWPKAAFGENGNVFKVNVTNWPVEPTECSLSDFLNDCLTPLSPRASKGFYSRAERSQSIRYSEQFLESVKEYVREVS